MLTIHSLTIRAQETEELELVSRKLEKGKNRD